MTATLKPKGQRPRCLHCGKELLPNLERPLPPMHVETGKTFTYDETVNYSTGEKQTVTKPHTRVLTKDETKQWRKDHPPVFLGTYGYYKDSRFCGLNCGYDWAVAHTHPQRT